MSSEPQKLRVSIVGASGYVGGELLRLLLRHPHVEVVDATSESSAGKPLRSLHPHLRGWSELRFVSMADCSPCDLLFAALPHGRSSARMGDLSAIAPRCIDLSADFRLRDASVYEATYGTPHSAPEWLDRFVYGLPEANRAAIQGATHVSGVGCNATASNLALLPLVRAGVIDRSRPVVVDLKVGSSEGGRAASRASHHPERSGVVRSFAPTGHRHAAEVRAITGLDDVELSVTGVELVRGALATAHIWTSEEFDDRALWPLYRESYGTDPFVRLVHDRGGMYRHPEPRLVAGTNHADVGWEALGATRRVVSLCAIDNLGKGAAGTAVQCMNLMAGFEERAGLEAISLHPA